GARRKGSVGDRVGNDLSRHGSLAPRTRRLACPSEGCDAFQGTSLYRTVPVRRARRITRFHHISAPVTNINGGTSPNTAQITLVVESQSPRPQPGIPRPPSRPKCR